MYTFNLRVALEEVIRDSETENKETKYNKSIQILVYADDIIIVGGTIDALKETTKLMTEAQVMGTYNQHAEDKIGESNKKTN